LRYPSAWAQVPPDHAQVRFKAVSRGGAGMDQCNVVVTTDPSFTNVSAAEFVDALIARGNVAAESDKHLTNFSMIDVWKGSVSGRSALYYVATHTYTVLDIPITLKGLVASTLVGENMYQITCQSPATNFDQVMPSFNRFMSHESPHFQMVPKRSAKTGCSSRRAAKPCIKGRRRMSGIVGMSS